MYIKLKVYKVYMYVGGSESSTRLHITHAQDNTRLWFKVRQFIKLLALICKSFKIIVLVFCLLFKFKMRQKIKNPTNCEVRSFIRFLNAQNVRAIEILRQITAVYGEGVECSMRGEKMFTLKAARVATEELKEQITNVMGETDIGAPSMGWFLHYIITFKAATT